MSTTAVASSSAAASAAPPQRRAGQPRGRVVRLRARALRVAPRRWRVPLSAALAVAALASATGAVLPVSSWLALGAGAMALAVALMVGRMRRLERELGTTIDELRRSRARIAGAAAEERRRLEAELHDGAQNRLVGLLIRLRIVWETVEDEDPELAARLSALIAEVEEAVTEVRRIAHGVAPSLLSTGGLVEALSAEARHAGLPVTVISDGVGLSSPDVETAVYYCCLEAVQNAAKHAGAGATVTVRLRCRGTALAFSVHDDGRGFAAGARSDGAGMTSMRDRIEATGGRLDVVSARGRGVTVAGSVPWPPRAATR